MPRGDKSKYTEKQKRQAEHIEEGYRKRGLSEETAESRAWATVNKPGSKRRSFHPLSLASSWDERRPQGCRDAGGRSGELPAHGAARRLRRDRPHRSRNVGPS